MYARDRMDGMSKDGCGRVAALKITQTPYCYTVEANYFTGTKVNEIPQLGFEDRYQANNSDVYRKGPPWYTTEIFGDVGRGICISLLDLMDSNPFSRIPLSEYKHIVNIKHWVAAKILNSAPYRFD